MLDGSEIGGFELNVMARERAKQQACLTATVDELHVEDFECLAAEENVSRLVARAVLGLFVVCH